MSNDNKLREALEMIAWSNDSAWQAQCAREALAALPAEKPAAAAERGAVATLRRRSFDGVQTYALNPTESPDGSMAWEALPVGDYPLFLATPPAQAAEPAQVDEPSPEFDVRKILLEVAPGPDGMGVEVYAKNVDEVVAVLGEMVEENERLRAALTQRPAAPDGDRAAVVERIIRRLMESNPGGTVFGPAMAASIAHRVADLMPRPAAPLATDAGVATLRVALKRLRDAVDAAGYSTEFQMALARADEALATTHPAADAGVALSEYTAAIGEAGQRYMSTFPYAHSLPGTFRWQELWDAMRAAAHPAAERPAQGEAGEVFDKGPWVADEGYRFVFSKDFEVDAKLAVDGDFASFQQRKSYVNALVAHLNKAPRAPEGGRNDTEQA